MAGDEHPNDEPERTTLGLGPKVPKMRDLVRGGWMETWTRWALRHPFQWAAYTSVFTFAFVFVCLSVVDAETVVAALAAGLAALVWGGITAWSMSRGPGRRWNQGLLGDTDDGSSD